MTITREDVPLVTREAVDAPQLPESEADRILRVLNSHRLARPEPAGQLLVSDFAWDAYDERAAAWIDERNRSVADNSVFGWRREHQGLHTAPRSPRRCPRSSC